MKVSSDSVETTVQSDLEYSMLEDTKEDFCKLFPLANGLALMMASVMIMLAVPKDA